jgi:hypothetical protein
MPRTNIRCLLRGGPHYRLLRCNRHSWVTHLSLCTCQPLIRAQLNCINLPVEKSVYRSKSKGNCYHAPSARHKAPNLNETDAQSRTVQAAGQRMATGGAKSDMMGTASALRAHGGELLSQERETERSRSQKTHYAFIALSCTSEGDTMVDPSFNGCSCCV